jgi:hypothetical protein
MKIRIFVFPSKLPSYQNFEKFEKFEKLLLRSMSFHEKWEGKFKFSKLFLEVQNNPYMFDIFKSETHLTTSHVAHFLEV